MQQRLLSGRTGTYFQQHADTFVSPVDQVNKDFGRSSDSLPSQRTVRFANYSPLRRPHAHPVSRQRRCWQTLSDSQLCERNIKRLDLTLDFRNDHHGTDGSGHKALQLLIQLSKSIMFCLAPSCCCVTRVLTVGPVGLQVSLA